MNNFRRFKPYFTWLFRIIGTGLFLWLILRSADLQNVLKQFSRITIFEFGILFFIFLVIQVLSAYRWKILLHAGGIVEKTLDLYLTVLYGQTINQILPSSIGGDSARVAYLFKEHPGKRTETLSATLIDRFLGFLVLFLIVLLVLPFFDFLSISIRLVVSGLLGAFLIAVMLVYYGVLDSLVAKILGSRLLPRAISNHVKKFWEVFLIYRSDKRQVIIALLLSLTAQIMTILSHYLTFYLLDIQVSLVSLFIVFPVTFLVVALPISIGGIGVREASLTTMLGISSSEVLSFTMIVYAYFILLPILLLLISIIRGISVNRIE